jgi:hypothetical protein
MLFVCRIIEEAPAVQVSTIAWPAIMIVTNLMMS